MTTINDSYYECSGSFSRFVEVLKTPSHNITYQIPLKGAVNEHARFNVWAGSVGAKHSPHKRISLDYRLRDADFYRFRVIEILRRLKSTLRTATELINGERPISEKAAPNVDQPLGTDSDQSSSSDEADSLTPERQIEALYESVQSSVKHLYSLAMVFRQPVVTDRRSRASKISVDHFISFDQQHIEECFPDASPTLRKRLANAITRRRQLLMYNEQHYRKSSEPQPSQTPKVTKDVPQDDHQRHAPQQNFQPPPTSFPLRVGVPAEDMLRHPPSMAYESILASTEATKFVPPVDMKEEPDLQSESGTISTFGFNGADGETLRIPPRPQDDDGEPLEQFLCPLCYHLIEVRSQRAWTRHVFRDLQAYVCTFENCEVPDSLFETRQDWIRHEFENHRREWHCNDPQHSSCGSESEFITHMKTLHVLQLSEPQLLSLAKLCARPSLSETFVCPLCSDGCHEVENGFERFKSSSVVKQIDDSILSELSESGEPDMAKLPEGNFMKTIDNTFEKVAPWANSLPDEYETQQDPSLGATDESQQTGLITPQRGTCVVSSSNLKRHIGQHLERLALFAISRSKLLLEDGKSVGTKDAVASFKSSNMSSRGSITSNMSEQNRVTEKRLKELLETDPVKIKDNIVQASGGGPFKNTFEWVFDDPNYRKWREDDSARLLWVKGGPGTGKTMLMCGIIDQIQMEAPDLARRISFFFCRFTDTKLRNATAVLRGLMFLLMKRNPSLWLHVPSEYDIQGKDAFDVLSKTLGGILQDQKLEGAILMIDALDECAEGLEYLLNFIVKASITCPAKWIVSSREWPMIHDKLEAIPQQITLSLEANRDSVSALNTYIRRKVELLAEEKGYSEALTDRVRKQLEAKSGTRFLWVAVVCRQLEDVSRAKVAETLDEFPEDLDALYDKILSRHHDKVPRVYHQILSLMVVAHQPLNLQELAGLLQMPIMDTHQLVIQFSSFLTVKDDFVHFTNQSARDFITESAGRLWSKELAELHMDASRQMLRLLKDSLHYNMYGIDHPGTLIQEVTAYHPDPLDSCRYSCIYWARHFCESTQSLVLGDLTLLSDIASFMEEKFVYWLEALSLIRKIPDGLLAMKRLETWTTSLVDQTPLEQTINMEKPLDTQTHAFKELIYDAFRFMRSYRQMIEEAPLQVYASALVFSPSRSIIRNLFAKDLPEWIKISPGVEQGRGSSIHNLEGHSGAVKAITLSMDGQLLASGSIDNTVKIWDLESGACLHTLTEHNDELSAVTFWNGEGRRLLASGSWDTTIKIWDAAGGGCVRTLQDDNMVSSLVFSPRQDKRILASSGRDRTTICIWDVDTGTKMHILHGHSDDVYSLAFSAAKAGQLLASGSWDSTVRIWDAFENIHIQTLTHDDDVDAVAFSMSKTDPILASGSNKGVKIWKVDAETYYCTCLQTFKLDYLPRSLSFSRNDQLACATHFTINIWDAHHDTQLKTIGHSSEMLSVVFSSDSRFVIGADEVGLIRVWDIARAPSPSQDEDLGYKLSLKPLNNGLVAASGVESKIPIWDATSRKPIRAISIGDGDEQILAHCPKTDLLASSSVSNEGVVQVWDPATGVQVSSINTRHSVYALAYSGDGSRLAASSNERVEILDTDKNCLVSHFSRPDIRAFCLSSNGALLASHDHAHLYILNLDQGKYLHNPQTLNRVEDPMMIGPIVFSGDDQYIALSRRVCVYVWSVRSGTCLLSFITPKLVCQLQFNYQNTRLSTEYGYISLSLQQNDDSIKGGDINQPARFSGYGLGFDRAWVMKDERRLVRLPAEYQPNTWPETLPYSVQDSTITVVTRLGELYRMQLDWNDG